MVSIDIHKAASYLNLQELERLFQGRKWISVEITMNYDTNHGLPGDADAENWPFKAWLVGEEDMYLVRIYSLTAGYGGSGPHDLANILNFFKITYNPDDIFTQAKMGKDGVIRLKFSR